MKQTKNLKLNTLELNIDGQMSGRTYLEMFSGIGENNLKSIDDFAGTTKQAIDNLKNNPSIVFINAIKETGNTYTATVPNIPSGATDLIINGVYILKLDYVNTSKDVVIRINGIMSKELRKIENDESGKLVAISVGDLPTNTEKLFRYNGQYLVLINNDALTLNNKKLSDIVLKSEVIDTLDSISTELPLSANKGKTLDEKIDTTKTDLTKNIEDTSIALDAKIDNTTDLLFTDFNYVYTPSTGILSLSLIRKDNTEKKVEIDLPLELIIESGSYDSTTKTIILVLANSDKIEIPVQDLFNEYFGDENTIQLYIDSEDGNKLKFKIKDGGIEKVKLSAQLSSEINSKAPINNPIFSGIVSGINNTMIGLGNVTDDAQVKRTEMGAVNGVATLDAAGLVPSLQLPSYVDDVLEFELFSQLPVLGEHGKIYVIYNDTKENNGQYRWSGSVYSLISNSLDYATQDEAIVGTENTKVMTSLRVKQSLDENMQIDNITIKRNNNKLTVSAILEHNANKLYKMWCGTEAEYIALGESIFDDTLYFVGSSIS